MTVRDMITELAGTLCRCGARKQARNTFCGACYNSLPKAQQTALYRRVGEGYEQAYTAAVLALQALGRMKP